MDYRSAAHWTTMHCGNYYCEMALKNAAELVKRNSVNPPGDEYEAALYCAEELKKLGFDVVLDEFEPRRCNVIATYGDKDDIGILFNGHLDVVPVTGEWKYPPFDAVVADGNLYGRGSADMKGGCAAMMAAAACIADKHIQERGIMIIFNSDEESVNKGMRRIVETRELKADAAVIGEPTEMNVCLGNKGYASYYITVKGLACHASAPEKGDNAIYKMGHVLKRLESFAGEVRGIIHPQLGPASFSTGTIKGGSLVNTVPDHCMLEVERRILPGETKDEVINGIKRAAGDFAEVSERSWMDAGWLDPGHPFVSDLAGTVELATNRKPLIERFPAGTESSFFSVKFGIPTLIMGPGSLQRAHKIDEYIPVQQIYEAVKAYTAIARLYSSAKRSNG